MDLNRGCADFRMNMYGLLSRVFLAPPDEQLMQVYQGKGLRVQLAKLFGLDAGRKIGSGNSLGEIERDYMDLFRVPGGRYVYPFEDVYRGRCSQQPGPLQGICAVQVKQLYRQAGAGLDQACKELPTHIGVELAFMQFLSGMHKTEKESGGVYKHIATEFLQQHLSQWYGALDEQIRKNARCIFYRYLSSITYRFLKLDYQFLAKTG